MTETTDRSTNQRTPHHITRRRRITSIAFAAPLAAALLTVASPVARAAVVQTHHGDRDNEDKSGKTRDNTRSPVTWQISGATCSQLPNGAVIDGTGTITNKIVRRTDSDGVTRVRWDQLAVGSATDQNGRHYRWLYVNRENVENSLANPLLYTGTMTDRFQLTGGPLALSNGFEANVTDSLGNPPGIFEAYPTSVTGDPITFPSGPGRCDPI